jgi:hypothetical protein
VHGHHAARLGQRGGACRQHHARDHKHTGFHVFLPIILVQGWRVALSPASLYDARMANKKMITNAETRQNAADRRTQMVRDEMAKERAATDAKTARLKALRLAQEQEAAAAAPPPKAKKPAKSKK